MMQEDQIFSGASHFSQAHKATADPPEYNMRSGTT